MLPSLFSFFALFWAFYALHSYTADQKNMAKVWSRVDRTRQSIRSGFNKSGKNIGYIIGEKICFQSNQHENGSADTDNVLGQHQTETSGQATAAEKVQKKISMLHHPQKLLHLVD